ncbi:lipoyl(octanoyl) transferase LipB [Orrella sp. JC864]|uniref:lipoyl(octanoyl) transferase LipB n=1 Tax=Orrella sp. JC864 TaxID=3120298 RepID=UPI0012BCD982
MPPLRTHWLARPADYARTWRAMRDFTEARDAATPDQLWLAEHPPVYTLGQAGLPEHVLAAGDIPVVRTDRGGQVTYHGPGQLLLYPLVDLRRAGLLVKGYVHGLEQAVIDMLAGLGIAACRRPGAPGVYVRAPDGGLDKIAALGIKIRQGRAYHGLALNVAMDLAPFGGINPCGYAGLRATDMAAHGAPLTLEAAAEQLVPHVLRACAPRMACA